MVDIAGRAARNNVASRLFFMTRRANALRALARRRHELTQLLQRDAGELR